MTYPAGLGPSVCGQAFRLTWDQPDSAAASAAAGTYTATIDVPAHCIILDAGIHCIETWNAGTSATGKFGDDDDDDGFFTAVDMKATDLTAGQSVAFDKVGGVGGAYLSGSDTHWDARYSTSDRQLKFIITTVGTAPTQGDTICYATWIEVPKEHPKGRLPFSTYAAT